MSDSTSRLRRRSTSLSRAGCAAMVSVGLLAGCGARTKDGVQAGAADESTAKVYEVDGRVTIVPETRDYLVIRHGDIPGFMDAMTMPFPLRTADLISDISQSDSIHFVIEVKDGFAEITAIEKRP